MKFIVKDSNKIDLHIHTEESDGRESVRKLLKRAKERKLECIAFTDHNMDIAHDLYYDEIKSSKIKVLNGCEISTSFKGKTLHLLAYNYNSLFKKIIIPKIQRHLYYKGPMNIEKITLLVHCFGGKVILAHPFKYKCDGKELVKDIVKEKIVDGIECIHSYHTQEEIDFLLDVCEKNNLLVSAGSDFHYEGRKIRNGTVQHDLCELSASNSTIEDQLVRAKQKYQSKRK